MEQIFDQSPNGNHLLKVVVPSNNTHGWPTAGINAMREEITVGGHPVFSAYFEGGQNTWSGTMGFRCPNSTGVAVGDQPESMYMVANGQHYNRGCCFDYGNAESRKNVALKEGTPDQLMGTQGLMEALYWGAGADDHPGLGGKHGRGPWVMGDLESGVWGGNNADENPRNTPITDVAFVTAMLKGRPGHWALKGGDANAGRLKTLYDGPRPPGYSVMKKQGAIVLGIGGDNSDLGVGTFYEGAMTASYTSDATDEAVHANIIAAGYGK